MVSFFDMINSVKEFVLKNGKDDCHVIPNGSRGLYFIRIRDNKFVEFSPVNLPAHVSEEKRLWINNVNVAFSMVQNFLDEKKKSDETKVSKKQPKKNASNMFEALEVEEETRISLLKARFPSRLPQKVRIEKTRTSSSDFAVLDLTGENSDFFEREVVEIEEVKKTEKVQPNLKKNSFPSIGKEKKTVYDPEWSTTALRLVPWIRQPKKEIPLGEFQASVSEKAITLQKKWIEAEDFARSTGKKADFKRVEKCKSGYYEFCDKNRIVEIEIGIEKQKIAIACFHKMMQAFKDSQSQPPLEKKFLKKLETFVKLSEEKIFIRDVNFAEKDIAVLNAIEAELAYVKAFWFPIEEEK